MIPTTAIAKALILDTNENVLVLTRSLSHPTDAGKSDLPGGRVEKGEDLGEAVIREVTEEVGIKVSIHQLRPLYAGAEIYQGVNRLRVLYSIRLAIDRPEIILSTEHSQSRWVPVDKLKELASEFQGFYHEALLYISANHLLNQHA